MFKKNKLKKRIEELEEHLGLIYREDSDGYSYYTPEKDGRLDRLTDVVKELAKKAKVKFGSRPWED